MACFDKYGVEFSDDHTELINCPPKLSGTYCIPNGVTTIKNDAFFSCDKITSIIIPQGVTKIGDGAFQFCESLETISIPNSVNRIAWSTFNGCKKLVAVKIPESVEYIEGNAFSGCDSLRIITLPSKIKRIEDDAFYGCRSLETIYIPRNVCHIGYAFHNCSNLDAIIVASDNIGYASIEGVLFWKFGALHTLMKCPATKSGIYKVPQGVREIGMYAFGECKNLTGIVLPNTIVRIDDSSFRGCNNLQRIIVPLGQKNRFTKMDGLAKYVNIILEQ